MKKTNLLLITFLILLSFNVFSISPFQESTTGGIDIIYPETQIFLINKDTELHYHLANSTGHVKTTNLYNCTAHVYNITNNHIVIMNLTNNANGYDKELLINGSKLNKEGLYSINLWCNTNNEAGYLSHYIYITKNGKDPYNPNNGYNFIASIIGIIAIITFLLIIYMKLDEKHYLFKTFLLCFSIYLIAVIPRIIIQYVDFGFSYDILKYYLRFLWIFTIYLAGYFIYSIANYYGKLDVFKQIIKDNFGKK